MPTPSADTDTDTGRPSAGRRVAPRLTYRQPTTPELALVKASWLYATPSESKIEEGRDGHRWITVEAKTSKTPRRGGAKVRHQLTASGWYRAHAALRDQILTSMQSLLIIAALDSRPNEAVAWVAIEKDPERWVVWWLHVVGEARGQGVGTALLRTVADLAAAEGVHIEPGQMTPKAQAWWDRVAGEPR